MHRAASTLRTPCCTQHRFHAALLAAPSCDCGAAPLAASSCDRRRALARATALHPVRKRDHCCDRGEMPKGACQPQSQLEVIRNCRRRHATKIKQLIVADIKTMEPRGAVTKGPRQPRSEPHVKVPGASQKVAVTLQGIACLCVDAQRGCQMVCSQY